MNPERIGELDQGSLNYPFGGMNNANVCYIILRDFPFKKCIVGIGIVVTHEDDYTCKNCHH